MLVGKIIERFVKPETFRHLKKKYLKIKYLFIKKIDENEFRNILIKRLNVKKNSVVFVHSSIDSLNLSFSFYKVLTILLEVVGEEGTIVFPCWHFNYRAEEYLNKNKIFDVKKSPTVMGILPEIARHFKNAKRSLHPTNSVVAVGKHANELVKDHHKSIYPDDENSPFYKIINYDGIIIGLGVSTNHLSFVHCVEDVLKDKFPIKTRTDKVYKGIVIDYTGKEQIVRTLAACKQIKNRDIEGYIKKYVSRSICMDFKIHGVKYFTVMSTELFKTMENLANNNITIYKV